MPSAVSPRGAESPQPDDLDRLLDYDNAVEDFMRDIPIGGDDGQQTNTANDQPRDEDQEVQVKRKRKPVPKLDENRLLSDAGIPKLRKITKTRLKFRGKGHEFADISRLLNTYQLWLDDLYPRAKFRDALTMVEKVGHSKRMQVTRRAWLDETKPGRGDESQDLTMSGGNGNEGATDGELFSGGENTERNTEGNAPAADELDDLLAEDRADSTMQAKAGQQRQRGPFEDDDEPDEDELDALLAESGPSKPLQDTSIPVRRGPFEEDDPDEDELDALMAEQQPGRSKDVPAPRRLDDAAESAPDHMDEFADDEDALASMGGAW